MNPTVPDLTVPGPANEAGGAGALGSLCERLLARRGEGLALKQWPGGKYVMVNAPLLAWLGRPAAEVIGRTDADLFDAPTAAALRAAEQTALAAGDAIASEHRLPWPDRTREMAVWRLAGAPDAEGRRWLASLWTDVSDRHQHEEQLRAALAQIAQEQSANEALRRELADQPLRDAASGLYTRAHFEEQLRREADLSNREHREFSIVFIEIDRPAGVDAPACAPVQAALGRLLRGGTRAMDAACKLDDHRFAVLLSGVGLATAHARMEGLRRRCATEIVVHEGQRVHFTVSMGVASFPHTAHSQAELVAACESALQEAQRRSGNHVTLAAIRFEGS